MMALSKPWGNPVTDANLLSPIDLAPSQPANQPMLFQAMQQLNLLIQQANQLLSVVQLLQAEQATDVTKPELAVWPGTVNLIQLGSTIYLGAGSTPGTISWDGTEIVIGSPLKASGGYEASDGTPGGTYSPGGTLVVKNGLVISGSVSSGSSSGTITDTPDDSVPYVRFNNTGPGDTNGVWVPLFTAMETWTGADTIATVGTITVGTWQGDVLLPEYGGTGLDTVGDDGTILGVVSGDPAWVDTTTITAVGAISIGIWEATVVAVEYGGTGLAAAGADGDFLGVVSDAPAWLPLNADAVGLGDTADVTFHSVQADLVAVQSEMLGPYFIASSGFAIGNELSVVDGVSVTGLGVTVLGGIVTAGTPLGDAPNNSNVYVRSGAAWETTTNITTLGTITTGTWNGTTIALADGGTGQTSLGTSGQLLSTTGTVGKWITLAGTTNQVIVTPSSSTLALSLPQSIATTSSPTFASPRFTGTVYFGTGTGEYVSVSSGVLAFYAGAYTQFYSGVSAQSYDTWDGKSGIGTSGAKIWGMEFDQGLMVSGAPIADAATDGKCYGRQYVSSAMAWAAVEPAITAGTSSQYWRGDKTWQTLNATAVGAEPKITAGTISQYWRGDKTWQTLAASGISDAPSDSTSYCRENANWTNTPRFPNGIILL